MTDNPEEYHRLLVHQNMEKIELAAVKAFQQQLETPVVLVLDPADPAAKAMAYSSGKESVIEAWIAQYDKRAVVTVLTWHLPARIACDLLRTHYPNTEEFAPLPDPHSFYTVVVSRGGMSIGESQLP